MLPITFSGTRIRALCGIDPEHILPAAFLQIGILSSYCYFGLEAPNRGSGHFVHLSMCGESENAKHLSFTSHRPGGQKCPPSLLLRAASAGVRQNILTGESDSLQKLQKIGSLEMFIALMY